MVATLLDNKTRVAITSEGKGTHILDLNHLSESDLKQLKISARQSLLDVNGVRDELYEFIRRVNQVLDTRTNNAACLAGSIGGN